MTVKNAHRGTYQLIAAAASNTRRLPACCHSACVTPGLGSRAPNPRKRTGQGALWSLDATLRQTSRKQLMYRSSLSCEVSFRVLSWRTLASKTIERYNWNFKISGYRLRQVRRARAREEGSSIDPQEGPKGDFATTGICKETLNFAAKRRQVFFQYVSEVQPEHSDQFSKYAPPAVEGAMRETINNLLGSLPPTYFSVSVSSVTENLAQLMYSMMMTGYMFRNAQYCMELRKSVVPVEVPPSLASSETPVEISDDLVVQGISMDELKVEICALRAEIKRLKLMAKSSDKSDRGELLSHINDMEPKNLRDLTNTVGPDVLDAMNVFIKRLLGTDDTSELSSTIAEPKNDGSPVRDRKIADYTNF